MNRIRQKCRRKRRRGTEHAETVEIFSVRCPAEQLFTGGGRKFYFPVRYFAADTGAGTRAGLSAFGAQEPHVHSDARRGIYLPKESDPDGGL